MKIGIFGGTFNPIHIGHLRAAEEVRERFDLTKIIFVPAKNPPLKKKEIIDPIHRYRMIELALSGARFFEISDIEYKRRGKSYTLETIKELNSIYSEANLYFILGIETFLDIPNWREPDRLIKLIDFIIISRPPFRFANLISSPYLDVTKKILERLDKGELESYTAKVRRDTSRKIIALRIPLIEVSGTEIRRLIRVGRSVKYLLPETVESYIISNKLYYG
ncbi:MAG: nicotinate-nucleotide adenylyltransferase [Nitrospirae bacterium]|nr:nicotinate-nucleotide adenylyltransferase [Nitrospirota bacterium]